MLNTASAASSSLGSVVMSWPWKTGLRKSSADFGTSAAGKQLGVVGVDDGVDAHRREGAVLVLVGGVDQLGALRLEQQQRAGLLPSAEILDGLEDREVGLHRLARQLLLDLLVERGAQAPGQRHRDAGKALLEVPDPAVMGSGRPGAVEHERLLELRLLVKLVDALGARRRHATGERCREQGKHARKLRQDAHGDVLRYDSPRMT